MLPVFVCLHVFLGWRQGECRLEYCINAIENKIAIMGGLLETESESIRRGMRVDAHCVPGGIPRRSRHYLQISAPISWTYQDVRHRFGATSEELRLDAESLAAWIRVRRDDL